MPLPAISLVAVPGRRSRHNLKYWQLDPYAGFGADAPPVFYEVDGEQYIAVGARNNVMAFKLNGPIEARPQPEAVPRPAPSLPPSVLTSQGLD
jgi:hypothetical protein